MLLDQFYTRMKGILNFVHKKRLDSLLTISQALIEGGRLSIANLGNRIINNTTPKHNIKKVDRLIGNQKLEIKEIYCALSQHLLRPMDSVLLLVDWSIYENKKFHVLQASLVTDGRSVPLYRDVYDITTGDFSQTRAEELFLDNLSQCIPNNIKQVTIVTDAGFKTPWFKKITSLGWYFMARLRGTMQVKLETEEIWKDAKQFYSQANNKPKCLGKVIVGKQHSRKHIISAGLYVYFKPKKGRESYNKRYSKSINELYSTSNKEPWVILTSLSFSNKCAKKVIEIYKKRMQIEQNFRDDKAPRWGFGFRYALCSTADRLAVYLLLATIAHTFLLMIGYMAEKSGLKKAFQVNTSGRRVLSLISLGKLIVTHAVNLKQTFIMETIKHISSIAQNLFIRPQF